MDNNKVNVILGATNNPSRAAFTAARLYQKANLHWIPIGIKQAEIFGKEILDIRNRPMLKNVDTVTLYIRPEKQEEWYDYILSLHPKRIIFNPGTENQELVALANKSGIQVEMACTLVLLQTGQYNS